MDDDTFETMFMYISLGAVIGLIMMTLERCGIIQ